MFAVISLGVYIFAALKLSLATEGSCRPILALTGHHNGFPVGSRAVLDCQLLDCNAVTNIKFELKGFASAWVTVYEYSVSRGSNGAKGSDLEYEYAALDSRHFLEIKNLTLHHHGLFKCIITDGSNGCFESNKLELNINVIPGKVGILPKAPNLVNSQGQQFTCSGEGIHPEPDVVWVLNGVKYINGSVANKQRDDGLWSVNNSIQLAFDQVGENVLTCIMKTTTGDRWIQDGIKLDVMDAAKVFYPVNDVSMTKDSTSTFTLNCWGSGYKPNIYWTKDGVNVKANGTQFVIKHHCTSSACNGSLTFTPISLPLQYEDVGTYDGDYRCIIALQPPYQSIAISSDTHINMLHLSQHINEPPMFDLSILLDAILIFSVLLIIGAAAFYFIQHRKKKNKNVLEQHKEHHSTLNNATEKHSLREDVSEVGSVIDINEEGSEQRADRPPGNDDGNSASQVKAKTRLDYQAGKDNEISFDAGDIITNIKQIDENWLFGEVRGSHGKFPSIYVEIQPETADDEDIESCINRIDLENDTAFDRQQKF